MFTELLSEGGLSLDRLKNFCAIAEAGGIARITGGDPAKQSLYSRQVRELEQFFGVELTRRKGKGIEVTEHGRELARQVRAHLQSLTDFKRVCAGQPIEFRIASGNSVVEWLLVPNLAKITAGAPSARFSFHNIRTADVVKGLKEHSIDFGILPKVGRRRAAQIPPHRSTRVRAVRTGNVGEGDGECHNAIVTTACCGSCRRRVQRTLSRVLRKGEADAQSSIQLRQFHPSRGAGNAPATPSPYYRKWQGPIF